MARVPTSAGEDAKRPNRERECLVRERTRIVNRMKGTLARLGIRNFKPTLRKAAERLATLHTPAGRPAWGAGGGRNGRKQGRAGAATAGAAGGLAHPAGGFLSFKKEGALDGCTQARPADSRIGTRKTMIVALARKLVIALWRFVTTGQTLEGVILRPAG